MSPSPPQDRLQDTNSGDWAQITPEFAIQMLHYDAASGAYSMMMRVAKGYVGAAHRHLAPSEFYVVYGRMEYRAGIAGPGTWGLEPTGAVHERTTFLEDSLVFFRSDGAAAILDEEGNVQRVMEGKDWYELAKGKGADLFARERGRSA